jgi:polyhydroxyalkanoate synthesis regulator phasin
MGRPVPISRRFAALATAAALCLPVAACGEGDVDKARQDLKDAAAEAKGSLNDLSKDDLQRALDDAENAAKNGSADTKKKARELQRKIERELDSRR